MNRLRFAIEDVPRQQLFCQYKDLGIRRIGSRRVHVPRTRIFRGFQTFSMCQLSKIDHDCLKTLDSQALGAYSKAKSDKEMGERSSSMPRKLSLIILDI